MKTRSWLLSFAIVPWLAAGCAPHTASAPTPTSIAALPSATVLPSSGANSSFTGPTAPSKLPPVPVPNLIPPTGASERLPQVRVGRPDPFAALDVTPTVVTLKPTTAAAPSLPAAPQLAPPVMSALPRVSTALPTAPMLSPSPGKAALSPAQAIEISGVVQTGSKTSLIVREPDQGSRYVSVGDYLDNGKVLVKRVEMGSEPVVILEQDGKEISRFIGGSSNQVTGL